MRRQANPKLIGAFVLGGLALLAAGLVLLRRHALARRQQHLRRLLPGLGQRVAGRSAGRLQRRHDRPGHRHPAALRRQSGSMQIPVVMALRPSGSPSSARITWPSTRPSSTSCSPRAARPAAGPEHRHGLLFMELDLYPEAPLRLVGAGRLPRDADHRLEDRAAGADPRRHRAAGAGAAAQREHAACPGLGGAWRGRRRAAGLDDLGDLHDEPEGRRARARPAGRGQRAGGRRDPGSADAADEILAGQPGGGRRRPSPSSRRRSPRSAGWPIRSTT